MAEEGPANQTTPAVNAKVVDLSGKGLSDWNEEKVKKHTYYHESKMRRKLLKKKNAEEAKDPFPGPAPIPRERFEKHSRGEGLKGKGLKTIAKKSEMKRREKKIKFAASQAARAELLLPEDQGFIEPDEDEFTSTYTQTEIKSSVDIMSATKQFDLNLQFGSYKLDYTRNGRHLLLGGRRGHVAAIDWVTKDLLCEMNVMESVHDVCWLHNETMFAVAQKEWTYIYDNQGIELHCLKKLDQVLKMEFLPYHFLLATASEKGWLSWLDVSVGKMVKQTPTRLGRLDIMCQNPYNAVLCCGHSKGIVTMWTPNVETPVAKMLCHRQPIRACAVDPRGVYLATAAVDATLKIWDTRNYKCLQSYKIGSGASNITFSQKGLLAASLGNIVEIYKDCCTKPIDYPYLKHHVGSSVSDLAFCPYEDVLGVSHAQGMCSMLVPGAGEPNFDALEQNPFQTKNQRREAEVKALLEKIQPELITLDPGHLGEVDTPTLEEKLEAKRSLLFVKPPKVDLKPRKNVNTAKQFHIKRQLQDETRRKFVKEVGKQQKDLLESKETKKDKPSHILDRFKAKRN